jgi:hypothetical protein
MRWSADFRAQYCGSEVTSELSRNVRALAESALDSILEYQRDAKGEISHADLEVARTSVMRMPSDARNSAIGLDETGRSLTRLIVDQWPLGDALGIKLATLEQAYGQGQTRMILQRSDR